MKLLDQISDAGSTPATSTKVLLLAEGNAHLTGSGGVTDSTGFVDGSGDIRQVTTLTAQTITANLGGGMFAHAFAGVSHPVALAA